MQSTVTTVSLMTDKDNIKFWADQLIGIKKNGRASTLPSGIRLDSVPSAPGAQHQFDGSLIRVDSYKSAYGSTAEQREEYEYAKKAGIDGWTGRLIDIKENKNGEVYFLVGAVQERRSKTSNGKMMWRCFNPIIGQANEVVIQVFPADGKLTPAAAARRGGTATPMADKLKAKAAGKASGDTATSSSPEKKKADA